MMPVDPGQAWQAYNDALNTSPLLVKSVTAGVILGAADLAGQAVQDAQREGDETTDIDIARTVRFAFFGLALQAPWNHFYYQLLDGTIPPTADPWTPTTAIKTVIDQFVQAPIFTVLIFAFLGFLEGKSLETIKQQLDDDYSDTMVANCKKHIQNGEILFFQRCLLSPNCSIGSTTTNSLLPSSNSCLFSSFFGSWLLHIISENHTTSRLQGNYGCQRQ
jgi:hypothetical protein